MPPTYDFPAKQRWREWMKQQVAETPLRTRPAFRRALLLDPELREVEMLETLGYRGKNIVVVERDSELFGELQERNTHRRRQGKEPVQLVNMALEDFFVGMILGTVPRQQFEHVSLDMLGQLSREYMELVGLMSAGGLLAEDGLFTSNLQAKREGNEMLREFDGWWELQELQRTGLFHPGADVRKTIRRMEAVIHNPRDHVAQRKEGKRDLKDLRHVTRCHLELADLGILFNSARPRSLMLHLGEFLQKRGQADWISILRYPFANREHLFYFLNLVNQFDGCINGNANMELETGKLPTARTVFDLPFYALSKLLKFHFDGYPLPESVRLYEYVSASDTPMLTASYHIRLHRHILPRADVPEMERIFFAALASKIENLSFRKTSTHFHRSPNRKTSRAMQKIIHALQNQGYPPKIEEAIQHVTIDRPSLEEQAKVLRTKRQVYAVFRKHPDWDVAKLKENYDVSRFTNGQLAAYRAWVTMRTGKKAKMNGNGLDEQTKTAILHDLADGEEDAVIAERHGVAIGTVRAMKAHRTMGTYAPPEETFSYMGYRFIGRNGVPDIVMRLVREYGDIEAIPEDALIRRNIRRE